MFLLDTNTVSELYKVPSGRAHPNVVKWFSFADSDNLYISSISLMELELGVLLMERRDTIQGSQLRRWMTNYVVPEFSDRTLPADMPVALQCASLHVPNPKPERDAWIAATALVHDMIVVTRNVADFAPMGVRVLNPWDVSSV